MYLIPFAATFGGLARFIAGMRSFKARDAIAATTENVGLRLVLVSVAAGCGCFAVGLLIGTDPWEVIAAYLFLAGALSAFYVGSAVMLKSGGLPLPPVGKTRQASEKVEINAGVGGPGVMHGR